MKNNTGFTPISINDCDPLLLQDYAYYCDDKVNMGEMPFSFELWQQANFDMAD